MNLREGIESEKCGGGEECVGGGVGGGVSDPIYLHRPPTFIFSLICTVYPYLSLISYFFFIVYFIVCSLLLVHML